MTKTKQWTLDMTLPIAQGSARHVVFFPPGPLKSYFGVGLDVYVLRFDDGKDGYAIVEPYETEHHEAGEPPRLYTMNFPTTSLEEAVCLYVQEFYSKHGIKMTTADREAIRGLLH